jgi:hypothetical protein
MAETWERLEKARQHQLELLKERLQPKILKSRIFENWPEYKTRVSRCCQYLPLSRGWQNLGIWAAKPLAVAAPLFGPKFHFRALSAAQAAMVAHACSCRCGTKGTEDVLGRSDPNPACGKYFRIVCSSDLQISSAISGSFNFSAAAAVVGASITISCSRFVTRVTRRASRRVNRRRGTPSML